MAYNFPFEMAWRLNVLLFVPLVFTCYTNAENDCSSATGCNLLQPELARKVIIRVPVSKSETRNLQIFCYTGQNKSWTKLFVNPRMSITGYNKKAVPDDMAIFFGRNASDVRNQSSSLSLFGLNAWLMLKEEHSFHPFNLSCIGLFSAKPYTISFTIRDPELWYIAYIIIGVVVFMCAPSWSRNVALHYTTGMAVGIMASVLLIMFLLTRLLPQRLKTVSYVVMAVSGSASLFMFQLVKTYLQDIFRDHWQVALGYVLVSGLASLALIYRFGPVKDTRTLNLVCWSLQACGLVLVYQGTQIPEASAALVLLVILFYLCPKSSPLWFRALRFRLFPPRHHFLTELEYDLQGIVETRKALEELREYCRSPDCDTWRVVSSLGSPSKFARFVDGDSHLRDEELQDHEDFLHSPRRLFQEDASNNAANNDGNNSSSDEDFDGEFSLRRRGRNPLGNGSELESDIEDTAYVTAPPNRSVNRSVNRSFRQ